MLSGCEHVGSLKLNSWGKKAGSALWCEQWHSCRGLGLYSCGGSGHRCSAVTPDAGCCLRRCCCDCCSQPDLPSLPVTFFLFFSLMKMQGLACSVGCIKCASQESCGASCLPEVSQKMQMIETHPLFPTISVNNM